MTKWEYRLEKIVPTEGFPIGITKPQDPTAFVAALLNQLGQDGWELVAVAPPLPQNLCNPPEVAVLYLKRPKPC